MSALRCRAAGGRRSCRPSPRRRGGWPRPGRSSGWPVSGHDWGRASAVVVVGVSGGGAGVGGRGVGRRRPSMVSGVLVSGVFAAAAAGGHHQAGGEQGGQRAADAGPTRGGRVENAWVRLWQNASRQLWRSRRDTYSRRPVDAGTQGGMRDPRYDVLFQPVQHRPEGGPQPVLPGAALQRHGSSPPERRWPRCAA